MSGLTDDFKRQCAAEEYEINRRAALLVQTGVAPWAAIGVAARRVREERRRLPVERNKKGTVTK